MERKQLLMIPEYASLDEALHNIYGDSACVQDMRPVSGGDANEAWLLRLNTGDSVFMKSNSPEKADSFAAEADGLAAVAQTMTIRVPKILCRGRDMGRKQSFLLMEYIAGGHPVRDFWEIFAEELYAMHRADTSAFVPGGKYGFSMDNYIGAGEQINTPKDTWCSFFTECRLEPQFRKAVHYFDSVARLRITRLLDRIGDLLTEPEYPSLLHGDLWSGNFIVGSDGKAWLIDPAVYVGHAEADLAMTELFGGFRAGFYDEYRRLSGLDPGYSDRMDLYNLYHLLNHLNLFGGGYYQAVMRIVDRYTC